MTPDFACAHDLVLEKMLSVTFPPKMLPDPFFGVQMQFLAISPSRWPQNAYRYVLGLIYT